MYRRLGSIMNIVRRIQFFDKPGKRARMNSLTIRIYYYDYVSRSVRVRKPTVFGMRLLHGKEKFQYFGLSGS